MKISTRLSIAALIPFLIVVVMTSGAVVMHRQGQSAQQYNHLTTRIVDSVSELSILANTYLTHYGERPKEQFLLKHAEVSALFDSIQLEELEEKKLAQSIRTDLEAIKVLFVRIEELHEEQAKGDARFRSIVLERLGGQLRTRASRLASAASNLALTVDSKTAAAQSRADFVVIILTLSIALALMLFLMRSIRYLNSTLTALHRGIEIISSGNLQHRVGTEEKDELGDLSRSFDQMVLQLRAVTVSRDVLNMEIEERERTERDLRKSEERFRKIFEEGPLGMLMADPDLHIRNVNSRLCDMLRYNAEELCNCTVFDITHPDDLQKGKVLNHQLLEGMVPYFTVTKRYLRSDGSALWVNLTASLVRNEDGNPLYFIGMIEDITDRKQAEDALWKSERQLQAVMESVPVGIIVRDVDNSLLFANEGAKEIHGGDLNHSTFGLEAGGALLLPDGSPFPPEELPLARALRVGVTTKDVDVLLRDQDGKERLLLAAASPIFDTAGNVTSGVAVVQDITGRKKTEEALKRAHDDLEQRVAERTEELASTIALLTEEVDERLKAEEKILRINRLYAVLSATNQAIVRASDRESLFHHFCRIAVNEGGFKHAWIGLLSPGTTLQPLASTGIGDVFKGVSPFPCMGGSGPGEVAASSGTFHICHHLARGGEEVPARGEGCIGACASVPIRGEGGVIGALTLSCDEADVFDRQQSELLQQMGRDISFGVVYLEREAQRRRAEQALQEEILERLRVVEALREKERMLIQQSRLAAMGEMISNIAHQWRQPLNVLGLIIQELQLVHQLQGSFRPGFLEERAKKSQEVISHMSGTIDDFRNFFRPEKEKVAFRATEALARTLSLVEGSMKNDQIEVEVQVTGDPVITGYPNEFGQVLVNILGNARDAFLQRRGSSPRVVTITLAEREGKTVTTIADNAGGIPQEVLPKVFDPYFTTKGPEAGTGIGLFMSKTIIEKNMQGRLTACNSEEGAVFTIEL
jgi:PAS domain S-box-containing protein